MTNRKKIITLNLLLVFIFVLCCALFVGCKGNWRLPNFSFSGRWLTSEDGFKYYVDDGIGVYIMEFPEQDEITVPEYIDGIKVMQLGCKTPNPHFGENPEYVVASSVKKLTITHAMNIYAGKEIADTKFPNLETLILVDCWSNYSDAWSNYRDTEKSKSNFRIDFSTSDWGYFEEVHPKIHLIKGGKNIDWNRDDVKIIEISRCVTVIERGTFDGIENVVIKTEWESQPEGWDNGWNSGLEVEWGVTFDWGKPLI